MVKLTTERLIEHLEWSGFFVMKTRPTASPPGGWSPGLLS
jgi:hypothetical protein